jgi:hypothetical protein
VELPWPPNPEAPPEEALGGRRRLEAPIRAVVLAAVLVTIGLLFPALSSLFIVVVITAIIALPLSAWTDRLERRGVPRPVGAVSGLVIGLGALTGLVIALAPSFSHEVNEFVNSIPGTIDDLRRTLRHATGDSRSEFSARLQRFLRGYTSHPLRLVGPAASVGLGVLTVIAVAVVVLITALYIAISPGPLVNGLLRVVPPARRADGERVLSALATSWLGWLRGLIVAMLLIGVLVYVGLRIVGLKYARRLRGPERSAGGGALLWRAGERRARGALRAHDLAGQGAGGARGVRDRPPGRRQPDQPARNGARGAPAPGSRRDRGDRGRARLRRARPDRRRPAHLGFHDPRGGDVGTAKRGALASGQLLKELSMLTVTPAASAAVAAVLESPQIPDGAVLRLQQGLDASGNNSIGIAVVEEAEVADEHVPVDAGRELLVAPELADQLDDQVLDAEIQDENVAFMIRPQPVNGGPSPD